VVREYLRHVARFSSAARGFLAAQVLYEFGKTAVWVLRNLYLRQAGFDEPFIGSTLAAGSLGMALVVVTLTPLMDQMRLRGFLLAGALLLSGGLAGSASFHDRPVVLAFCLLSGVGIALLDVPTAPFVSRHAAAPERPYLFGVTMAVSPMAGLLATLGMKAGAVGWGETEASYRNMLLAAAAVTAASSAALLAIRESAPPEAQEEERERFDWPVAAKFFLPELAFGLGAGLTIPFINLYFNSRFGVPAGTIALYYSGAQALMMGAFLAAPLLARRFGSVRTIVAFQLSSIPFFLVLALTTSLPVAVGAFLLRHASMNMVHPVGANFAMEVVHPRQRARVNGMKQAANKLSWVMANSIGGWLVARPGVFGGDGFQTTMSVTIALYVLGSVLYWRFFRLEPAGRVPAPETEPTAGA
jgi:MFS family permease